MTRVARAVIVATVALVTAGSLDLHADTVQLSLRDGRLTLVATNAVGLPQHLLVAMAGPSAGRCSRVGAIADYLPD